MRFIKFILTATFLIGLFPVKGLYSQTFIIPEIGASLHNIELEEFSGGLIQSYEGLKNNFDFDIGIDFKHYLTSKWFLSINSNIYMKRHFYSIYTLGINPRTDYSYRLFGYGLKTGIEIINNFEIGLGISRIHVYDQKVSHSFMVEQNADSGSLYFSTIIMSYKWDKFIAKVSYSKSLPISNMYGIELFSIHFGYMWQVFEPIQQNNKVNCPKF